MTATTPAINLKQNQDRVEENYAGIQEQSVYPQSRDNKYWAETNETCAQYYTTNTIREPAAAGTADIAAGAFAEAARTASACR